MLEIIKNPAIQTYAGMLRKPDVSLVLGDLSANEYDIQDSNELSLLFEEDNSHDLMLGLFDNSVANDVFDLFTSEAYLQALDNSGDLVFVGLYHLGEQSLIIWAETIAAGQDFLHEQSAKIREFIYIPSFSVSKAMLADESHEFQEHFRDYPKIKAALSKIIFDES